MAAPAARHAPDGEHGDDIRLRYRNPVELRWAHMIKFDHEFIGRVALERQAASPRRAMVTLVWDKEDILDVHRSQLEPGEAYLPMDEPGWGARSAALADHADQVLDASGSVIGVTSGRTHSWYWGNPGTR